MRGPGISDNLQSAFVDRYRGASEGERCALAVAESDPRVGYRDQRACGCFKQDAPGGTRHVADHEHVLFRCLDYDLLNAWGCGKCKGGTICRRSPETGDTDRIVRIAMLKFNPHSRAD